MSKESKYKTMKAKIKIEYSQYQEGLSLEQIGFLRECIAADIEQQKESKIYPTEGEFHIRGINKNLLLGVSVVKYAITWSKQEPTDNFFIKEITVVIE